MIIVKGGLSHLILSKDECPLFTLPRSKKKIWLKYLNYFNLFFISIIDLCYVYLSSSGQRIAVDGPLQFLIFPPIPPLLGKEDVTRALTDSENGMALYHLKNVKLVSGF